MDVLTFLPILLPFSFTSRHKELSEHKFTQGKFKQQRPLQDSISLKRKNIVSQYKYRFCNLLFMCPKLPETFLKCRERALI